MLAVAAISSRPVMAPLPLRYCVNRPTKVPISSCPLALQHGIHDSGIRHILTQAKKRRLKPSDVKIQGRKARSSIKPKLEDLGKAETGLLHTPVLLEEAILQLGAQNGGIFIDATFGMGGHSSAILNCANTTVLGLDRDPMVLKKALGANAGLKEFALNGTRLKLFHGRFSQMMHLMKDYRGRVDGILMDIGVSSVQLDTAERGFSYREELDAPLDMRMDQTAFVPTAFDIVNNWSETQLADLIYKYGEDKRARTIAKAIEERRKKSTKPIATTFELAQLISSAIPRGSSEYMSPGERIAQHAKRTFQALRIEVNQELEELKMGLRAAEQLLRPGGKLVVITFHSLEDRIVKDFFNATSGKPKESKLHPELQEAIRNRGATQSRRAAFETSLTEAEPRVTFDSVLQKITKASDAEIEANKRSKPAKLRAATRTSAEANDWDRLRI